MPDDYDELEAVINSLPADLSARRAAPRVVEIPQRQLMRTRKPGTPSPSRRKELRKLRKKAKRRQRRT